MQVDWVGSKMPGKPWVGTTAPMCVLHTLEFNAWPDINRWDSPSHYVYNPNTRELRQYVSTSKAAYSLRNNSLEDDYMTIQVELWGKAANVPGYDDNWYEGVAALVSFVNETFGIPLHFADFSVMQAGTDAPQRMPDAWCNEFSGFLGHAHFGKGVDTHWDPGKLDIGKVKEYLFAETEPTAPNLEKCEPHQIDSWIKAWNKGLVNEHTHPEADLTKGDQMVFFDRLGLLEEVPEPADHNGQANPS